MDKEKLQMDKIQAGIGLRAAVCGKTARRALRLLLLPLVAASLADCAPSLSDAERSVIRGGESEIMHTYTIRSYDEARLLRMRARKMPARALRSDDYRVLRRRMLATVNNPADEGVGIAAPQVGVSRRVIAVQRYDKAGEPLEIFINPEILQYGDSSAAGMEGCLSVPVVYGKVLRPQSVRLRYRDEDYRLRTETVCGFTAVILQHEIDHLNGVLFIDRMIPDSERYETE